MAAAGLPYPVVDNMLQHLIEEGTHESLHAIVDICVNGVLGAVNRVTMRAAFTPVTLARMRLVYTHGHYPNQRAVAVAAAATLFVGAQFAPPLPALITLFNAPKRLDQFPLICRCTQCFAFLCKFKGGIITESGFTELRRSYLLEALEIAGDDAPGVNVAVGIIERLPFDRLKWPQRLVYGITPYPNYVYIFGIAASRARPMKAYIRRIRALHVTSIDPNYLAMPVIDYSGQISRQQIYDMASWIDAESAFRLRSWSINFVATASMSRGSAFNRVIVLRNPHRYTLLPWMQQNTVAGDVNCNTVSNTSLNPDGSAGWAWPPVGAAMYMGDVVSVRALATIPECNFNLLTPVPGAGAAVTVGVAASYALTWNALSAFKEWLIHAGPLMEAAGQFNRILDILYATIKSCSDKRVAINAEPLPAGALITAHRRSRTRRRQMVLDVALAFVYTIQEETFHTITAGPDGTMTMVRMYETIWYRNWVTNFKAANRVPATRTCRDVVPLINVLDRTTNRLTRSGRNASNRR